LHPDTAVQKKWPAALLANANSYGKIET
jgi:hypothetical protein